MTVEADESYAKGVAAIKAGNMDDAIEPWRARWSSR